jgi:hypothetical protein
MRQPTIDKAEVERIDWARERECIARQLYQETWLTRGPGLIDGVDRSPINFALD